MAAVENKLMTVEEFRALPRPVGPFDYELHEGVLVPVTRPKLKHAVVQGRIRDLLRPLAPVGSYIEIEMAFRARTEFELRVADVGYLSPERWAKWDPEDNVHGAPDLVVEVLSPSNSANEMLAKEELCLEAGASEFWIVDPKKRQARVTSASGSLRIYKSGQAIPLTIFGSGELAVDAIFS